MRGPFGPYLAAGIDFDGTLTERGAPDAETLRALEEAREAGLRLVLVTGRILAELAEAFPDADKWFDALVVENGAVLAHGSRSRRLVAPVPLSLDELLVHRDVRFRRGQVLLASTGEFAPAVLEGLSELGLDVQIVRNRNEIMLLPAGVSKASGFMAALAELGISPHNAVGIGDAENDHSLLRSSELGVAVANAVRGLRESADLVLDEPGGRGVAALLRRLRGPDRPRPRPEKWGLEVGRDDAGAPVRVDPVRENLLIRGATQAGKSYAVGVLVEALLAHGYSACVLDPEGDHAELGALHACLLLGGHEQVPTEERLARFYRSTFGSLVVDLSLLPPRERAEVSGRLLQALQEQRARTGLPHVIVVEEAHVPLGAGGPACPRFDPEEKGLCLVSYQPERLCDSARRAIDTELEMLGGGKVWLRPASGGGGGREAPFVLAGRSTRHVRHRHKYAHAGVDPERRFWFVGPGGRTGRSAGSLGELHRELCAAGPDVLLHHARHRDLSRWVADVLRDVGLARAIARAEERASAGGESHAADAFRDALLELVEERYLA